MMVFLADSIIDTEKLDSKENSKEIASAEDSEQTTTSLFSEDDKIANTRKLDLQEKSKMIGPLDDTEQTSTSLFGEGDTIGVKNPEGTRELQEQAMQVSGTESDLLNKIDSGWGAAMPTELLRIQPAELKFPCMLFFHSLLDSDSLLGFSSLKINYTVPGFYLQSKQAHT